MIDPVLTNTLNVSFSHHRYATDDYLSQGAGMAFTSCSHLLEFIVDHVAKSYGMLASLSSHPHNKETLLDIKPTRNEDRLGVRIRQWLY